MAPYGACGHCLLMEQCCPQLLGSHSILIIVSGSQSSQWIRLPKTSANELFTHQKILVKGNVGACVVACYLY